MILEALETLKVRFKLLDKRCLLAVSGGLDSMVMLHIFQQLHNDFIVAHGNFNLRGAASDGDENLVKNYCSDHGIPFYVKQFNTVEQVNTSNQSIQMAARQLRYDWFNELLAEHKAHAIITAHHLDDQIETFFINLNRGAGLGGLTGIKEHNNTIYRPFLNFKKSQFLAYAQEHKIEWREDKSNQNTDYLRNNIRHHLIPKLYEVLPQVENQFKNILNNLNADRKLIENEIARFRESVIKTTSGFKIKLELLLETSDPVTYLFYLVKDYGYTQNKELADLINADTGKRLENKDFYLVRNRDTIELAKIHDNQINVKFYKEENRVETTQGLLQLTLIDAAGFSLKDLKTARNVLQLDADKITDALILRNWRTGDKIKPYGMKGSKLVSDLLIDNKVSFIDKEKTLVLTFKDVVLWAVGHRTSAHYNVTSTTSLILKIEYLS